MDDPAGAPTNEPAAPRDDPGPPRATPPGGADPSVSGPLDRATATALLGRADELLDSGDLANAARFYERVVGFDDAAITAAALLGLGTVFYRADQEDVAIAYWRRVLELPETPGTYLAWRQLAAASVRAGELQDAIRAYREAERRAPAEDRAEIASRLGWLAKETGDQGAARRYFARSRGGAAPYLTYAIIAVTTVVSLLAFFPDWAFLMDALQLDKPAVAAGEYYRLLTVTLLHGSLFHLFFNMYALYFAGSLVEQIYGWRVMGLMYVLTGLAASMASFVFGGDIPSVGASGAVYGMFGVLLAASRTHNPVLDRRGQAVLGQIGILIVINLVISFATPGIDYQAHIGGLLAGVWLGFLFVPGRVPTLSRMWRMPAGNDSTRDVRAFRILGVVALIVVIVVGVMIGTAIRV